MFGTMLNTSEGLALVLCLLVFLYIIANKKTLLSGKYAFITYGFFCIGVGCILTNLEEFLLEEMINIVEHLLTAAGAMYVAIGCRRILLGAIHDREEGK